VSLTQERVVECQRCHSAVTVHVLDSLNADRHPALRDRLLDGTLHRFECAGCGDHIVIDHHILYIDQARRQIFFVFPRPRIHELASCLAEARAAYDQSFGDAAPPEVRRLGDRHMVRVCFGLDQLRDKVIADAAGLSDLVLEELKCELLATRADLRAIPVIALWLVRATGDTLELITEGPDGVRTPFVTVPRAAYDEIALHGHAAIVAARPALVHGPHISMLGALLEA
jgi:hypothetical protein